VVLDLFLSDRAPDLVEDGYDVGIFVDFQKFDASMIARQLAMSEIMLCASPEYVKKYGEPDAPEDIARHACLNFAYEALRHHWPIADESGTGTINIPVISKVVSNNTWLLRQCALAGMGIMIRTSVSLYDDLSSGRLVRLLPHHHLGRLSISMVYPSRRLLSAKVRSFVDFMISKFPHPEADPWLLR
jgi:DNA-binding transcriptional LysR family regulator